MAQYRRASPGPVVVDGESFLDALFASAAQKAEALGSIGYTSASLSSYKSRVEVDDRST